MTKKVIISGLLGGSLVALGLFAGTYGLSVIFLGLGGLIISPTAPCMLIKRKYHRAWKVCLQPGNNTRKSFS